MHLRVKNKARQRLQERNSKKFTFINVSEEKTKLILSSDVSKLRQLQIEGRELNLITEEYYDQALREAEEKDKQRELAIKNGRVSELGLLHGIPISIKDHICEEGKHSTVGVMSFADNIAQEDAIVVQQLRAQGAIPMVKGNTPQLLLSLVSENDIYGKALNPHDTSRTCGGSSGGDGGLVASKCIPLAFGTDIAGSIRCPSEFCGIYGFKPTTLRVSSKDIIMPLPNGSVPQCVFQETTGPLGYSANDLKLGTQSLMGEELFRKDPNVIPLPFDEQRYQETLAKKKLRFGYFYGTDIIGSTTSVKRAILMTKEKLVKLGHEFIPFQFSKKEAQEYVDIHMICCTFGCQGQLSSMFKQQHDRPIPLLKTSFDFYNYPRFFQKILSAYYSRFVCERIGGVLALTKECSRDEIDDVLRRKARFTEDFIQRWEDMKLDAMISPTYPTCAFKFEDQEDIGFSTEYQVLWNVVNFPTGCVPITEVLEDEEADEAYQEKPNDVITAAFKRTIKGSKGMPVGIQVSTPRWKDEECLAIIKIIGDQFNFIKMAPQI
ncbi:amidase family protein [Stylonychia lemnae]|uniref:Amidase family protein n=1 Tax=Stylonychia lemnae TaxID=5949 RepID=A0A078A5B8_STYLE|nr:amidase family protein [Stylonychia lemnae]|eukprot:CDW76780.1 amidase family protein [Stylonychia lemnae]